MINPDLTSKLMCYIYGTKRWHYWTCPKRLYDTFAKHQWGSRSDWSCDDRLWNHWIPSNFASFNCKLNSILLKGSGNIEEEEKSSLCFSFLFLNWTALSSSNVESHLQKKFHGDLECSQNVVLPLSKPWVHKSWRKNWMFVIFKRIFHIHVLKWQFDIAR